MAKKLEKTEKGISITLEPHVLEALGIDSKDNIIKLVIGDKLIVQAKHKNEQLIKKHQEKSDRSIEQTMDKYGPVLEKLSKS